MPHLETIKSAVYFKLLNPIQQKAVLTKTNRRHLNKGIIQAKKLGIEKWRETTHFSYHNQNLIHEMLTNKKPHGKA